MEKCQRILIAKIIRFMIISHERDQIFSAQLPCTKLSQNVKTITLKYKSHLI